MTDDGEPLVEAVPTGCSIAGRWGFLLDNVPDESGGGYFAGELLLRSDGALLQRPVIDTVSGNVKQYKALGPWQVLHRFDPDASEDAVEEWLQARQYQLKDSPNIPVEAEVGPEIFFESRSAPGRLRRGLGWLSLTLAIPLLLLGLLLIVLSLALFIREPNWWNLMPGGLGILVAWFGRNAMIYFLNGRS